MTLLLILFQKEIWLPFFSFFIFFSPQGHQIVDLHWVCDAHKCPDGFHQRCHRAGASLCCRRTWVALGQECRSPSTRKGGWAARTHLHRLWSVNYCFSLSPFTMYILKLLSLPISLHSADNSILLGGSSGAALSSPAFAVLLLRKMVEKRYMNFTTNRIFPCRVIFDPESHMQYLSQGHILKHF